MRILSITVYLSDWRGEFRILHDLFHSRSRNFLEFSYLIRGSSFSFWTRRGWPVCRALFARSLTRTRTLIWSSSFWNQIILTFVWPSGAVIANRPSWIASNFPATTNDRIRKARNRSVIRKEKKEKELTTDDRLWLQMMFPCVSLWVMYPIQ